jgi:sialic acid synthase SpsE
VGYSDHTLGTEIAVAAVALGASVIEKHFTLDRNMEGPDHKASLEPIELKRMVQEVRHVEVAFGNGEKCRQDIENENLTIARKSIHTSANMDAGTILTMEHLIMLRPGDGISPMQIDKVLGKPVVRFVESGHKLSWSDLGQTDV